MLNQNLEAHTDFWITKNVNPIRAAAFAEKGIKHSHEYGMHQ
jgi:hypothetical protein